MADYTGIAAAGAVANGGKQKDTTSRLNLWLQDTWAWSEL